VELALFYRHKAGFQSAFVS